MKTIQQKTISLINSQIKKYSFFIVFICFAFYSSAQTTTVDNLIIKAGVGNGVRFWNNTNEYKIHMGNTPKYKFGPVTDYSMKFNMSTNNGRGWVFGSLGKAPVAAISNAGHMKLKGYLEVAGLTIGGKAVKTPNFGQIESHGKYKDFNTPVKDWGWSYVQSSLNGPNNISSQWYRFIGSLGKEYNSNQYRIEIAYPRFNGATAGVWMRTMEGGKHTAWIRTNGGGSSTITKTPTFDEINVTSSTGKGVRFWGQDNYKIHMGTGTEYKFGPVTDYAIKSNMSHHADRGWVWGVNGKTPVAAISNEGHMKLKGNLEVAELTIDGNAVKVPNFGQTEAHSKYKDFNTPVNDWGWSYVQSSLNGPNNISSQWYRFIGSLGKEYNSNQFRLEIAYPRFNAATAGVWMRTMEGGKHTAWIRTNGAPIDTRALTLEDNKTSVIGPARVGLWQYGTQSLAAFMHKDLNVNLGSNFGLVQSSNGQTWLNSAEGKDLTLAVANGGQFKLKANGNVELKNSMTVGKSLSVTNTMAIGTAYPVDGSVLTVDGRVHISEEGGVQKGFSNKLSNYYKDYLLWVEEGIVTKDIAIATVLHWPDYVFNEDYELKSLSQVEAFIKKNGHLPTMPKANEVEEIGISLGDISKRTVKTIEELTLHTIKQQKLIEEQKILLETLVKRISLLESDKD